MTENVGPQVPETPSDSWLLDRITRAGEQREARRLDREASRETNRGTSREQRVKQVRAVARSAVEQGARVHVYNTTHPSEVGTAIEAFEAEGWRLAEFSTHFRDYRGLSLGTAGAAEIAKRWQEKSDLSGSGRGSWMAVGDVYVMLFRYVGDERR